MEEGRAEPFSPTSPHQAGDAGKELLRHLLRDKTSPANTPSPITQAPPIARRQLSSDGCRSEEEDAPGSHGNMVRRWPGQTNGMSCDLLVKKADHVLHLQVARDGPASELLDAFGKKKTQRCKRPARPDKDRAPPKYKRKKKEEEEKALQSCSTSSSSDPVVTHLRQVEPRLLLFTEQEADVSESLNLSPPSTAGSAAPHGAGPGGGSQSVPPLRQFLSGPRLQAERLLRQRLPGWSHRLLLPAHIQGTAAWVLR